MSLESYLASSGVPVDDVRVRLSFELFVRVELPASVELVLQVAEHLLGGGVVQAVALAAHGLADAEAFEQVMHVIARLAPVRVVPPPRVPGADGASQSHAPHDPGHALGRHSLPELVDQAHAHLPVAAPVRRAPARASVRASVWISSLWACPWASARAPPDLRPGTRGTSVPGVRRSRSRAWP